MPQVRAPVRQPESSQKALAGYTRPPAAVRKLQALFLFHARQSGIGRSP
jgi:hypothetical protein